jgi:hypothetical protein
VHRRTLLRMTHDPQTIAWLDQEDARLAQIIRTHRFAVQYVWSGDEPDEPGFGYTVGLFGLGHPELVVVGLDQRMSHGLLDRVAGMVVDGRNLVPGEVLQEDGRDIIAVEVLPNPGEILFSANRFYERPDEYSVPALQLTWADASGRFPRDPLGAYDSARQPRPGRWRA